MNEMVSVIIPVYNTGKYLDRCIESLINQTYQNIEILIVDDGSTDNSGEICDSYKEKDHRIVVVHQANAGQSAARNTALNIAKGTWISFVDSDDYVSIDYIEHLHGICKKYGVRIGQCAYKATTSDFIEPSRTNYYDRIISLKEMYTSPNRLFRGIVCAKIFEASLLAEYRFPVGKIYEDEDASFKLLYESGDIALSNKCCYYYFQTDSSTTRGKNRRIRYDIIDIFNDRLLFLNQRKEEVLMDITEKELCIRLMLRYISISENDMHKSDRDKLWTEFVSHYNNIRNKRNIPKREMVLLWNFYHLHNAVTSMFRVGYSFKKSIKGIK